MPTALDTAFGQVKDLVANFKANESFYLSPQFSEAQTRKDFIDKLFIALGWDVNHDTQKNPYAQEVKIEKNESGTQGWADYAFYLSPNFHNVRFFAEAKKPHGEFGSAENYFQTLRYGWGGKTPLAILTNFEEFHILDSRYKPHIGDTLSRVVKKFSYADYADAEKFAEIYWLFSREAVANNSLAKYAETLPKPKSRAFRRELFKGGEQSPDKAFLIELDGYRSMLAKALKSKNPNLNSAQLTEFTQRVIDRLVFIRFLEDKQIEPTRHLERFGADGGSAWEDFVRLSVNLDLIYNGVVFKGMRSWTRPVFKLTKSHFASFAKSWPTRLRPTISPPSRYTFWAAFMNGSWAKSSPMGRAWWKSRRFARPAAFITRPNNRPLHRREHRGQGRRGQDAAEIAGMRFADIACGSGSFLLEVFDCWCAVMRSITTKIPARRKKAIASSATTACTSR